MPTTEHQETRSFWLRFDRSILGVECDIDFLVEFRPGARAGFFRLADIEAEWSQLLGGRKIDLRTPMDLSRYFRDEAVRHALVLYAEA